MRDVAAALGRIEADVAFIRRRLAGQSVNKSNGEVKVPVLQGSYTPEEAERVRTEIEAAFRSGLISYDKKRGMKMTVRKATIGWSPVKD